MRVGPRSVDVWIVSLVMVATVLPQVLCATPHAKLGILLAETPGSEHQFCIKYYPSLHNLTAEESSAKRFSFRNLVDLTNVETCEDDPDLDVVSGKVAFVSAANTTGNCSIAHRSALLQLHNSQGLLSDRSVNTSFNASEIDPVDGVVATFYYSVDVDIFLGLKETNPDSNFALYGPEEHEKSFDWSIMVIFAMAVFTVCVGSLWSGYTKHYLHLQQLSALSSSASPQREASAGRATQTSGANNPDSQVSKHHEEDVSIKISPIWVVFFVICMCGMLVLLYFFFNQLVYVIIGMFVIATIVATYSCLEPLVMWTYRAFPNLPTLQLPRCNLFVCVLHMELRQLLLMALAFSASIVWVVFRKEDWAWVLQDILGIMFSINMLKVLRLPSLMICTILLSILFFYDIFFVFITPLLTPDGKSIMVEVATGGDTGEQLPMVLKVPHLSYNPLAACWVPYSMLGFGDILVPGLLLSYCHSFDLLKGTPFKVYWFVAMLCYSASLLICFVGLILMNYAQPALLYIVPCTLIPVSLVALCRGEFKEMWEGDKVPSKQSGPSSPNQGSTGSAARSARKTRTDEESGDPANEDLDDDDVPDEAAEHNAAEPGPSHGVQPESPGKRVTRGQSKKEDVQKLLD